MKYGQKMKPHKRLMPYIRRATGREKSDDFRTAYRLAFYNEVHGAGNFVVVVQRGALNRAIMVAKTKHDIDSSCMRGFKKFKQFFKKNEHKGYHKIM